MSFKEFGLHESILSRLAEIGYETPTPIQREAIPLVMQGRDLLGSAQTGTGKTAAFMLPVLHRLLTEPAEGTQVLVLEPTRELALQVEEQAKTFSKLTHLRSACIYGGVGFGPQEKAFADGVEVIAATPGRLLDHIRQGNVRFDKLRVLVLDEVDRMLDMGFLPDVRSILRQLPERRQTLFFSATVPTEIGRLADSMLKDPAKVAITPDRKTAEGITQAIYPVSDHLKTALLEQLLNHEHVTSALVFTRTKQGADKVCAVVERMGLPVQRIHGDLSQAQRLKALAQFKEGVAKFLVATDIAARGLDVEGISHVINYDLPDSPDDYVHRIGRTARASATGHAYSLFAPRDAANLAAIERHLGQKIEKQMLEGFNYEEPLSTLHEVRQGHDGIKDYDDLGSPSAGSGQAPYQRTAPAASAAPRGELRPAPYSDGDERASVNLVFALPGMATMAPGERASSGGDDFSPRGGGRGDRGGRGGDGGGDRKRGRGGRGGGGRGGSDRGDRGPSDRGGSSDRAPRSDRPAQGFSGGGEGRPTDAKRGERHQANASLSASDVLRKASDQQAVVGNDTMGMRPRPGAEFDALPEEKIAPRNTARNFNPEPAEGRQERNEAPREERQASPFQRSEQGQRPERVDGPRPARAEGDGDGEKRKRRRRRGRGGQGGERAAGAPMAANGQRPQGGFNQGGRPQGGNNNGQRFDRGPRGQQRDNNSSHSNNSGPKPSLWQRLKSTLGMGGGSGDLGGKW